MQFDQTNAVVTGAASGLGEATAQMLAHYGAWMYPDFGKNLQIFHDELRSHENQM
jgi:NAD(P)-dependent dehydrogenase (short-subunit alcohol dehydrogenase family)